MNVLLSYRFSHVLNLYGYYHIFIFIFIFEKKAHYLIFIIIYNIVE